MKKKVIFLDDDVNFLNGIKRILKDLNQWDVLTYTDPDMVFQELALGNVGVVVSDYRMPGIDGLIILGRIKDKYPSVHRILLSGQATDEVYHQSSDVAERYLEKPCEVEMIIDAIKKLLGE